MAAVAEMGEVDDIHSKEDATKGDVLVNGDNSDDHKKESDTSKNEEEEESMEVDSVNDKDDDDEDEDEESDNDDVVEDTANDDETESKGSPEPAPKDANDTDITEPEDPEPTEIKDDDGIANASLSDDNDDVEEEEEDDDVTEVHTIDSDDDDVQETAQDISEGDEKSIVITDSHNDDNDEDDNDNDDVMIVDDNVDEDDDDSVKENGTKTPEKNSDDCSVIELSTPPQNEGDTDANESLTPRRSSRQIAKKMRNDVSKEDSDESDIEEVVEEDPLACTTALSSSVTVTTMSSSSTAVRKPRKSSTIVVNDTKRLVEIASKTTSSNSGKKEPTLVIIDTNSILSGRGPVPVSHSKSVTSTPSSYNVLPMALPAQGMYPPNMRATITPIPMNNTSKPVPGLTPVMQAAQTLILPSLTDDMFVVEAPSFIVPYVYEKPPVKDFREYVNEMADVLKKEANDEKNGENDEKKDDDDAKSEKDVEEIIDSTKKEDEKRHTYFDSPIGKFFMDIGYNLVQEYVQTDLLKQQKRKREREGGTNNETNKTIQSLLKSLEYTKENNEPYKTNLKRCEFCSYKTDSMLAMAFHLETPHMKNFVYRCNFCTYEVRSPHDILFHMEAEHCVRGRLERAPAFHQCPNCPFEDNQKGKLSRHSVACAKKFKAERNLEPPLDWEPPAKIPRQPRMKQPNLAMTAAMYQAMAKNTQAQFIKVQQTMNQTAMNRGRGRPSLGMPSKPIKPKKSQDLIPHVPGGGSVLVPTNFQISGNQLYQVVGGQELGSRLGGPIGLIPTLSSTSNAITIQNSSSKSKTVHQPSISITPLPRGSTSSALNASAGTGAKPGDSNSKNSFVICEICDGYIKDLEQLRNHMQWIHKVKIHPKMIYNRPPLNCQKCQFRFFTDQGLERHLLGSHGLVTSSMQEAANKCKDSGRCPVCGRVYQWKLLNHVARDHNMTLKPAHLSYKCTVCTATFGMYKQFENHVYSAHSVVAKRSIDKKSSSNSSSSNKGESLLKPLKINDEITIIPQMPKSNGAGSSKESSPATSSRSSTSTSTPGTSRIGDTSITRAERLARRKTSFVGESN